MYQCSLWPSSTNISTFMKLGLQYDYVTKEKAEVVSIHNIHHSLNESLAKLSCDQQRTALKTSILIIIVISDSVLEGR